MAVRTRPLVAIFLPDLRGGGAERLHVVLAREFISRGIEVDMVLRLRQGQLLSELPEAVRIHALGAARVRNAWSPFVRYLRDRQPCAVLAAMWPLTVMAPAARRAAGFPGRIVVSEHSPQSAAYQGKGAFHRILMRASMAIGYRLADARVGVSSGVVEDMANLARMSRDRFSVVFNPAATGKTPLSISVAPMKRAESGPLILSVGNLKRVKRQDQLIRAFATADIPESRLCIVGEGPERASLELLAESLGVADRVFLPGYCDEVSSWYAEASLFVLSSEREGFGNVLVEAMEFGLPIVSTDCPAGPREILGEGRFGTLVPVGDVGALANAMRNALSTSHDRDAVVARALDFSVARAADSYIRLLLPDLSV